MQQRHNNYLKMTSNVITGMEQEIKIWEEETEIARINKLVKALFDEIGGKNQIILSTNKSGFTSVKDNLLENLTKGISKLIKKMSGYAKINNDYALLPLVNLSLSALTDGPETEVVDRYAAIIEKAAQILPLLASFKVTTEQLDILRQLTKDYKNSVNERSTIGTGLVVSNEQIISCIAALRIQFDILDDLVEGIIEDEGFIARYKSWRKIPGYGKGKTLKNPEKPLKE